MWIVFTRPKKVY